MRHRCVLLVFVLVVSLTAVAQTPAEAGASQAPPVVPADQQNAPPRSDSSDSNTSAGQGAPGPADQKGQDAQKDKKGNPLSRLGRRVKDQMSSGCVNVAGQHCWDKDSQPDTGQDAEAQQPPRSATNGDVSSSKERTVSIAPPPGDAAAHAGVDLPDDIREVHPWDPHKSDHNVEVGDFEFKRKQYRAAVSRYQEALYWRDNNAVAMYRLALTLEKVGHFTDARKYYQSYVKTLPNGPFAADAHKALQRLKDKPDQPVTAQQHF